MMATGVFEEEKVGVRPAMGMVVERNPNRPFLVKIIRTPKSGYLICCENYMGLIEET
jgi:hypothetical protein